MYHAKCLESDKLIKADRGQRCDLSSSSGGSGAGSGADWQSCQPPAPLFSFRNTVYNIRDNRQAQGTGHGPPTQGAPLSGEPQREEQPSPDDPRAPGEPLPRSELPSESSFPEPLFVLSCVSDKTLQVTLPGFL